MNAAMVPRSRPMDRMPETASDLRERLVLDWQDRVYGLALRMLRNRHEAEDATQDVFVRLLERAGQYDPSRPAGPWVYRVATSVILNRARRSATRRSGRTGDLPARQQRREEAPMAGNETQEVVEAHLDQLPAEERIALLLHVQHGMSKQDVAKILAEPRTTVQSRLGRALGRMRSSLEGAGYAAVLPGLDAALRNAPLPRAPDGLTERLLSMAASTAASAAAPAVVAATVGGIVVTKNMIIAAGVAAIALLATGFAVGRIGLGETSPAAETNTADVSKLREENERLREALREKAEPRLAGATAPARSPTVEAPDNETDASGTTRPVPASNIAWDQFAKLFAENIDLILTTRDKPSDEISAEAQQRVMMVLTSYMQVSAGARALSKNPYFDKRVLPDFTDAVFSTALGLDDKARANLRATVAKIMDREIDERDVGTLAPLERYATRTRIQNAIEEHLRTRAAAAGTTDRLERVHPVASTLMRGAHQLRLIGLTAPAARVEQEILRTWEEVYALGEDKLETLRPLATDLAGAGRDILVRHDLLREGAEWDADSHPQVAREMLQAQQRIEAGIVRDLDERQLAHASQQRTHLIQFSHGTNASSVHATSGGI